MIERWITPTLDSALWGRQMRFVAGPRQSGKTTLAKSCLQKHRSNAFYFNWDKREVKLRNARGEDLVKTALGTKKRSPVWVCFDEIHKMPKWKNILKSYFDNYEDRCHFLVTGSARLDWFRRSGDSLAGRYFLFHLFPLTLFEVTKRERDQRGFLNSASEWIQSRISGARKTDQKTMEELLTYSGFPEPFLRSELPFLRLWRRDYLDRLIREDMRDLTRVAELENIATLVSLLPERIGSPLSVNSLRGFMEVSHETITNYLKAIKLCYLVFEVPVYTKKISRAIKKEKKVYFFDWTRAGDLAKCFENYIAVELLSWITLWSDTGLGDFELRYIKNRHQQECDFLILKEGNPWLLLEAKLKDQPLSSYLYHLSKILGNVPVVQLTRQSDILHVGEDQDYRISASRFFSA